MNKVTLITDNDGNVIGGSLASSSEIDSGVAGKSTIAPLDGQRIYHDVALTSELLMQEDDESLVRELLAHRIDARGSLERKA